MGVYVTKFRELIDKLPKTPDGFLNPVHASSVMATLTNATLQTLASLEEALEDAQKENERLQELLMEKNMENSVNAPLPDWWPKS